MYQTQLIWAFGAQGNYIITQLHYIHNSFLSFVAKSVHAAKAINKIDIDKQRTSRVRKSFAYLRISVLLHIVVLSYSKGFHSQTCKDKSDQNNCK